MKTVAYGKAARKTLLAMPRPTAKRIRAKVAAYAADPASMANNVKVMKGMPLKRLRVGNWRVLFEDDVVIEVVEIGARGSGYD
ncbi:MAG: type II toxin-antitoxin system RelE/ParE family toxin [Pseudomonadota bacterium]